MKIVSPKLKTIELEVTDPFQMMPRGEDGIASQWVADSSHFAHVISSTSATSPGIPGPLVPYWFWLVQLTVNVAWADPSDCKIL